MVLVAAVQFTRDFVTRSACAAAVWTSALDDEIRKNAVKREAVVEAALREFNKVGNGARRIRVVKFHGHVAFFGMDDCFFHAANLMRKFLNRRGAEGAEILHILLNGANPSSL